MNHSNQSPSKGQAFAVRQYLQSLGVAISHTQALEVIARGQGLRSRHVLPASTGPSKRSAQVSQMFTMVSYRYTDGSNCKRQSQVVLRGRFTPAQLKFIQGKLDAGEYFVPAQVGLECLAFAFNDFGGEDHGWHVLDIGDEDAWTLDAEGFVLQAGAVEQVESEEAFRFATDADCDNFFLRFAQLTSWDPELQLDLLNARSYTPPEVDLDEVPVAQAATKVAKVWHASPGLELCSLARYEGLVEVLHELGFAPRTDISDFREWSREVGPNAYQYVILQAGDEVNNGTFLNHDVSTHGGERVTNSPLQEFGAHKDAVMELASIRERLDTQRDKALYDPRAWSDAIDD